MGVTVRLSSSIIVLHRMKFLPLLLAIVPGLNAGILDVCVINSCSSYWSSARNNRTVSNACAVMFDESCCKTGDTHLVVQNGQKGKLCGTVSSLNPFSSCKGPRLEDSTKETTRTRRTDMTKRSWFSQHKQSLTGWKSWMTISVIWTRILVPTGVPVVPTTEAKYVQG